MSPPGWTPIEWAFLTAAVWLGHGCVRQNRGSRPSRARSPNTTCIPTRLAIPSCGAADTNRVSLDKFFIAKPNAEMVLSNSLVTLRNPKASAHDRAVSLCVALHLFGDLHQPLHAANLVTKDKPKGNGLGGSFLVRDERGEPINLHTYWDYSPGPDLSYSGGGGAGGQTGRRARTPAGRLPEYQQHRTIPAWVQESFRVAVDFSLCRGPRAVCAG